MNEKDDLKEIRREQYLDQLKMSGMNMRDAANLAALASGRHWEAQKKVLWSMKENCAHHVFGDKPLTHEEYISAHAEFRSIDGFEKMVEGFAEGFNLFIKEMNAIDNGESLEE